MSAVSQITNSVASLQTTSYVPLVWLQHNSMTKKKMF